MQNSARQYKRQPPSLEQRIEQPNSLARISSTEHRMPGVIPYECAAGVSPALMEKVVRVESSGNPFAIGVVGRRLVRQPKTLAEAVATARSLEKNRFNYSIGISQINRVHFDRLGWKQTVENGFDRCANLFAGAGILKTCYDGAVKAGYVGPALTGDNHASRASLSCYYSGNYVTGEKLGYVDKVLGRGAKSTAPRQLLLKPTDQQQALQALAGKQKFPSMFD